MKVYELEMNGSDSFLIVGESALDGFIDEFKYAEVGDKFTVSIIDMDEQKFKDLPEFDGF